MIRSLPLGAWNMDLKKDLQNLNTVSQSKEKVIISPLLQLALVGKLEMRNMGHQLVALIEEVPTHGVQDIVQNKLSDFGKITYMPFQPLPIPLSSNTLIHSMHAI